MKFLFLLPILLLPINSPQNSAAESGPPVVVLSFKWFKDRQAAIPSDAAISASGDVNAIERTDKNFERHRRGNDPGAMGDADENIHTRGAALDNLVSESDKDKPRPVDGYTYETKIQNTSSKSVKVIFVEFEFVEKAHPTNYSTRQFVCRASVKPDKQASLKIFTKSPPLRSVSVDSLDKKLHDELQDNVLVNRVEYEDGSVWQREGWNLDKKKLSAKSASASNLQPCRGL